MDKKIQTFRKLLSIVVVMAMGQSARCQYVLRQASEQAALYNYAVALPLYADAYNKKHTLESARGLAESNRLMKNYAAAESWYIRVMAAPSHTPVDNFHYAEVLINNSKYAVAKEILTTYLLQKKEDTLAINMLAGCDSALLWLANPVKGKLENVEGLNSKWSDWSTTFSNGELLFASDRPYNGVHTSRRKVVGISKNAYGWTGNSYLHLYESNGKDSSSILPVDNFNGDYHSATVSYTADGKAAYVAVTTMKKKGRNFLKTEKPYSLNVEILEYKQDTTGKWQRPVSFPYNAIFNYSAGDPWISPDGKMLYFVADYGSKGLGGTDIYYCRLDANGKWDAPVNLGPGINTAGDERTPVLDSIGVLYFASNGRAGMGGLDIYKATRKNDGSWVTANLQSPVNGPQDDFAPAFENNNTFYFSSNRLSSGKGSDDIYRFETIKEPLLLSIKGRILDGNTNQPLPGVAITLKDKQTGIALKVNTDKTGTYSFSLDSAKDYTLDIIKADYCTLRNIPVTTRGLVVSTKVDKEIAFDKLAPYKGWRIQFGRGKWDIDKVAVIELDRLVKLLKANPTWKVEMASHTDSRSADDFNMKLSQKRADATVAYLVAKGITRSRLDGKGYGETKLLNRCANGVDCSEEEHQQNRRTEFSIIEK